VLFENTMLTSLNNDYTLTEETFESITSYWLDSRLSLSWECLFVLPPWLKVWWSEFGSGRAPYLWSVRHKGELIGIAPLMVEAESARLMGDSDVCDYLDVIVTPGRGAAFFEALLPHLRQQGISQLDLEDVRDDSVILGDLLAAAKRLNCTVFKEPADVSMELDLPTSWDAYLKLLTGKERHEIRRKLRRLNEAARINFRIVESEAEVSKEIDQFLDLFKLNRGDKSDFMTDQRARFFRSLAEAMAAARILKLFFLDLDEAPAAAVMCFDYHSTRYLYNNGYDNQYRALSVGLLSKVFTIQDGIQRGNNKYDFLKGTEAYKHRLGGKPVQLYRCQVKLG
jgi:CelD/BcsL family acetyltransferase involved in cellulose biosynthesis